MARCILLKLRMWEVPSEKAGMKYGAADGDIV